MSSPKVSSFDTLLRDDKIMIILRNLEPLETVNIANAAWDAGIEQVEVPIGQPHQVAALEAAVAAGAKRGKKVGAGTVISTEHLTWAHEAGAAYTVAPGLDLSVIAASAFIGLPHLPGVQTASEVQQALNCGLTWMKVFPASVVGPAWFKAMKGPFPDLKMVATGGISASTAADYLSAGANVIGVGSSLGGPQQLQALVDQVKALG